MGRKLLGLWFQRANHSCLQLEGRINLEDDTERWRIWGDSGEIRSPGRRLLRKWTWRSFSMWPPGESWVCENGEQKMGYKGKGELIRTGYGRNPGTLKITSYGPCWTFSPQTLDCHHEHQLIVTGRFVQCNPQWNNTWLSSKQSENTTGKVRKDVPPLLTGLKVWTVLDSWHLSAKRFPLRKHYTVESRAGI